MRKINTNGRKKDYKDRNRLFKSQMTHNLSWKHIKRGQAPAFLLKTYEILMNPLYDHIIRFNAAGNAFTIYDEQLLAQEVLPKMFRHQKLTSFIRQLNMYGFKKFRNVENLNEFSHPYFRRGQRDQLYKIGRANNTKFSERPKMQDTSETDIMHDQLKEEIRVANTNITDLGDSLKSVIIQLNQKFESTFVLLQATSLQIKQELINISKQRTLQDQNLINLLSYMLIKQNFDSQSMSSNQRSQNYSSSNSNSEEGQGRVINRIMNK